MNDSMSILLATTILALGGLGLYMYKSSDVNVISDNNEDSNEDSLFGGSFWASSDDKEIDDSENLEEDEIGISPGQACVFYSKNKLGDKVLGGGWITKAVNKYLST